MPLIRWEPVGELNTIQHEMNRLFNTFFESTPTGRAGPLLEDDVLTISGEREAEHAQHQGGYDRPERALGGFFPFPDAADPERRGGPRRSRRAGDQNSQA